MFVESLAASFLVSELLCESVFNCGQIRGRENTKDLWGLQRCCEPEPLTCQQQILTSWCHLVLLSFVRGAGKHFQEGGESRSGTDGLFPWAGRMTAACMGADGEMQAGREERSLPAPWVT